MDQRGVNHFTCMSKVRLRVSPGTVPLYGRNTHCWGTRRRSRNFSPLGQWKTGDPGGGEDSDTLHVSMSQEYLVQHSNTSSSAPWDRCIVSGEDDPRTHTPGWIVLQLLPVQLL